MKQPPCDLRIINAGERRGVFKKTTQTHIKGGKFGLSTK